MDPRDLDNRFTYHAPKDGQPVRYELLREGGRQFAALINVNVPDSREKSLAITHLETAVMFANAAIARNEA